MIKMSENGKLKKGVYKNSSTYTTQLPFVVASRFQRKYNKSEMVVSPYNTTFKKLPF